MVLIKYYFSRSFVLFILALLAGIVLPQGAAIGKELALPALTIILTVTLLRMPRGFFRHPSKLVFPSIWGNASNFLLLSNIIIWPSLFLVRPEGLWIGIVLIAAVPPAVAVLPLSKLFSADENFSFAGLAGAYVGSILFTPLIGFGFLKHIPLNHVGLILLVLQLVLLPLLLSRIIIDKDWDAAIEPHEEMISNWCFFIVFYALVANSFPLLLHHTRDAIFITLIAVVSTFFASHIINLACSLYRLPQKRITSLVLLGTLKNYGLAGGIALTVFNNEAALPAIIFTVVFFIYELDLKRRLRKINFDKRVNPQID